MKMKFNWKQAATGFRAALAAILLAMAAGCVTSARSISNSGYQKPDCPPGSAPRELSELDVLGIEPGQVVSDEDIARAREHAQRVSVKPGSAVLLVQSGAEYPDAAMVKELSSHFQVVPFTGLAEEDEPVRRATLDQGIYYTPGRAAIRTDAGTRLVAVLPLSRGFASTNSTTTNVGCSRLLRLAAARAGADTILCYWGILEGRNERIATKTFSWMPFMGWVVPDECEHLRIRVKMAVVDVRTGAWSMLTPDAIEDKAWSTSSRRAEADQKHVEALKARAYSATAGELFERYAKL